MSPDDLLESIASLDNDSLISFLEEESNSVRLCFLQVVPSQVNKKVFARVMSTLAQKLTPENISTNGIQSLYTHLAFYFKNANMAQYVDTCTTHINDNIFRKRLSAWLHYKRYNTYSLHITEFENYLTKLSNAILDDEDDYTYEILSDLNEYKLSLPQEIRTQVLDFFEDESLAERYPILKQLKDDYLHVIPDVEVEDYRGKIHMPSIAMEKLFNDHFIDYIKENQLFGYSMPYVTENIIKKGQADFDLDFGELKASQVVKLYCYCNMRMHFFSSISLYERSEIVSLFYKTNGKIKFIDIGSGPGTCGLAFADHIHQETGVGAVFDYFGVDTSVAMNNQAEEMMKNSEFSSTTMRFCSDIEAITMEDLKQASCIIINTCYVFASEDLPIKVLANYINKLSKNFPYVPKYLLFQNPINDFLNRRYEEFKTHLSAYEITYTKKSNVHFSYQRGASGFSKERKVLFEILKF